MTPIEETDETQASALCQACGLCCTGHLFIWVKLRPSELDPAESLGMTVFRSDPTQRGFSQPCPLWHSKCTIYTSRHYPHACRAYKCKLLKELLTEKISLLESLTLIKKAKEMFYELEALLPDSPNTNFRERFVACIEQPQECAEPMKLEAQFQRKAETLLTLYKQVFGVKDVLKKSDSGKSPHFGV